MRSDNYSRLTHRIIFLLLVVPAFIRPLTAQTAEVVVMVNGPWSYVGDPDPSKPGRIVIIAPVSDHHNPAKIFSGGEHGHTSTKPTSTLPGRYDLDILNLVSCSPKHLSSAKAFPIPGVDVPSVIKPIVQGPNQKRYAFSLPAPCYFESIEESRSKLDLQQTVTAATSQQSYTTLMALHYFVSSVSAANLKGTSDDRSVSYSDDIAFARTTGNLSAISIVMYAPDYNTDFECDYISAESVKDAGNLFGKQIHVQFPELYSSGQQTSVYSENCIDDISFASKRLDDVSKGLIAIRQINRHLNLRTFVPDELPSGSTIEQIRETLKEFGKIPADVQTDLNAAATALNVAVPNDAKNRPAKDKKPQRDHENTPPLLEKTSAYMLLLTAGAGDCHGGQISVNGVVP